MGKTKTNFVCEQCGYSQSQWSGRCPNCDTWNSMVETLAESDLKSGKKKGGSGAGALYKASEIVAERKERIGTGDRELDEVLGGGLVLGEVVLIAGEPGIGKSTLLTQVALNANDRKVLYVCGEESFSQVALRIKRMEGKRRNENLFLFESRDVDEVMARVEIEKPDLLIIDSIQTLTTSDLSGADGSVGQVRECASRVSLVCKKLGIPVFIVGHVTKDGNIAGPRVLEHMVDCVLWFEGERGQALRMIRAVKNRFGPTDNVGVWEMRENGLLAVDNPSSYLLSERVIGVPGSVVSVVLEGRRPLLIEIQALAVPSQLPSPRRVSTGVDASRLAMLVAVLMRRGGLHLENVDLYVNVTGGIRLADRGVDLAICIAIASAFLNKAVEGSVAAVGEVGLLGEVRKVGGLELRIKEAKKLGFRVASAESGKDVSLAIKKLVK